MNSAVICGGKSEQDKQYLYSLMEMKRPFFILAILGFATLLAANEDPQSTPIINTPLGRVKGSILTSRLGRRIFSFRGIRYAEPPINELRFQPPVPVKKWNGTYDASKDGPLCPQPVLYPSSEDCLRLNVYTAKLPNVNSNSKRPVIVYMHAGGYYSVGGTSTWAGPNYYLDQDIVLVTINYRLGSLGFLSLGTKDAPGNNGLKDQVAALKWIKSNIEYFGGDPNSVTLTGYSAGGISVILHMLSPMSKGLFHKAIAMSGSPLGTFEVKTDQLDVAKTQARLVQCPEDTPSRIIQCLKNVSAKVLGDSLFGFKEFGTDPILIWGAVIEKDFGQERFLTAHPINLVRSGQFHKVPLITGQTKIEFGYNAYYVLNNVTLKEEINNNFDKIAPIAFSYEREGEHSHLVSRSLKSFYFHDKPIDKLRKQNLSNLYADSVIGFSVHRAAKLISQHSTEPVYYYRFSYKGQFSHFRDPQTNKTIGAVHHDDLIYLFYVEPLFPFFGRDSPPEVEMVAKLTKLYATFAASGSPASCPKRSLDNIVWPRFNISDQKYLDIGNKLVVKTKLYEERYRVWERLYPLSYYDDK